MFKKKGLNIEFAISPAISAPLPANPKVEDDRPSSVSNVITKNSKSKNILLDKFVEQLNMPFSILDLEKKIISLFSRHEFSKRSIINLQGYTIVKKDDLELQLTEKEVNFLILFSKNNKPLSRNFVLKNVWNYSLKSETHTIETHIHRLRKKIFQKFNDDNFIKNNNKGYYI